MHISSPPSSANGPVNSIAQARSHGGELRISRRAPMESYARRTSTFSCSSPGPNETSDDGTLRHEDTWEEKLITVQERKRYLADLIANRKRLKDGDDGRRQLLVSSISMAGQFSMSIS